MKGEVFTMFGVSYFSTNVDEYFMVLNNPAFNLGIIDDNPAKYQVRNQFGVTTMPRKGVVMLSSLLPPPEAVTVFLDGRDDIGANVYTNFLNTDLTAQNIISVLLKVLFTGKNIVLFIPRDEATSISFVPVLGNYFFQMFGICIGDIRNPASASSRPNELQYANILNCMYLYDNLSYIEFCSYFPENIVINEAVSNKIITDNNISLNDVIAATNNMSPTMQDIVRYANEYARRTKYNMYTTAANVNKPLIPIINVVDKGSDGK